MERIREDWPSLIRQFKEKLAQRLWALPTVAETEKEILFRNMLADLDDFEKEIEMDRKETMSREQIALEENNLLRSLMGVPGDDLKTRFLTLSQELASEKKTNEERLDESTEIKRRLEEITDENDQLRKRLRELEQGAERFRMDQIKMREEDVRSFSNTHEELKNELKDLESRLGNMRHLFAQTNDRLLTEKQEEVTLLQKRLLDEMESALRKKQQLSWNEEEMFAKGIAHRVRTALVSAQGQLMLTLERLGLLNADNKTEAFWKPRLRLFIEGASELSKNFRAIQILLQNVTGTLDDYLHLTHRRDIIKSSVSLKDLVQRHMAEIYSDRKPTLSIELLSDDPLPDVEGDEAMLKFVIEELIKNGVEAMPEERGKLTISLKNLSDHNSLQVLIKDSGPGIPEHLVPRLFQPFFTTKSHRQGLSLSRAKRYIDFHGGKLDLISTGSQGTTFQVELPLVQNRKR